MGWRVVFEGVVVGLAAQVLVGWVSPFSLLFTGLMAGLVTRNRHDGLASGVTVGAVVGLGFMARYYLGFGIAYLYPAAQAIDVLGVLGVAIIALIMFVLGTVGGTAGGSLMQRTIEDSYRHGEMFGEGRRVAERLREEQKPRKRPRR